MNWYQLIQLLKGHKTYLQTHNFPDPDALASAFGMQQFLKKHGIETTICYEGSIDKLSTKRMITEFGMEVFPYSEVENEMQEEDYIVTIDGQKYNANFTDLPGDEVACIDHHPTYVECEYKYSDIRIVGACSSLVAEYFVKSRTPIDENTASALMYGLRMDTASLTRGVTELDIEMFSYLYRYADNNKIMKFYINTMEMSDLKAYGAAIENIFVVDGVGFAHIPFSCNDALIAMISDFILSLNEVGVCVIYADRDGGYKLSVRSLRDEIHAGKLTADALEGIGNGGGHAAMAGGVIYPNACETILNNIEEIVQGRFLNVIKNGCEMVRETPV
ncbi:MAG: DHH family phosphoesterase [Lachnospiraceae bacterium]|nr:DHH family phosphoesterase [Lachnospiraceae bacterium]